MFVPSDIVTVDDIRKIPVPNHTAIGRLAPDRTVPDLLLTFRGEITGIHIPDTSRFGDIQTVHRMEAHRQIRPAGRIQRQQEWTCPDRFFQLPRDLEAYPQSTDQKIIVHNILVRKSGYAGGIAALIGVIIGVLIQPDVKMTLFPSGLL